jgi:hypothetical protein
VPNGVSVYTVALGGRRLTQAVRRQHQRQPTFSAAEERAMIAVRVDITQWVDDAQPGWVACRLVDASGTEHTFIEKAPVVTTAVLDNDSRYPQPGWIACEVLQQHDDRDGQSLVAITTAQPWTIASRTGQTRFDIRRSQLEDVPFHA